MVQIGGRRLRESQADMMMQVDHCWIKCKMRLQIAKPNSPIHGILSKLFMVFIQALIHYLSFSGYDRILFMVQVRQ